MHPPPRDSPREGALSVPVSLPPLRQLSNTPPTPSPDRRAGNPLGVHSILNPQAELAEQQRNRRRSASQMIESPSPVETQPIQSLPSISRPTSVDSTQEEPMSHRHFQPPGRPSNRHILSPRSPSLVRTQSLGVLNPPTGTIDAQRSPFLTASTQPYAPEPVTSHPPLPTPPVGPTRVTYFPTVPPTAPTPPPNMIRNELRRSSVSFPQSGSASPIASYSPYSQPASVASSQFETSSQQGSYMTMPNSASVSESHHQPLHMESERNMIPMAPSSQTSIQIMTIKSQGGHSVQIPVDVQAASKVADEKRKRNAGASARFRARRKEKEREASQSIARLEQQLRDALEDAEYYRSERDYFKSIVYQQQPGAERHYARPPSPRLRRLSTAPSNGTPSTNGAGSVGSPYSAYEEELRESDRNVRRRTSSYHPANGPAPTQPNAPVTQQGYAPANFTSMNPPAPQAGVPSSRPPPPQSYEAREQRPLSDMHQSQPQRPSFHDPFAEQGRHENRSWVAGPSQARDNRG
ncbi:hypothetical protein BS50DRAFT_500812 [Corynespora cassiicola Philippines]|uniref:BZIP domain-containing protein n=1 Tax=Corynespora cassiicola Philippines TaxID=1448308 RepID=A0A2T2ND17_CORCC|nr:hypothetical protein BS50DRAFT_500812 [Corynespora cassiicola Philippines]